MGCGSSSSADTSGSSHNRPSHRDDNGNHDNRRDTRDSEPTGGSSEDDFVNEALNAHNDFRSQHGAPPLRVSEELNAYSQEWANKIAKLDEMKHSKCKLKGDSIGENIYMCWSSDPKAGVKAKDAVKSWYDEIKDYNYNNPTFGYDTGHFTQVVWKGTKEMGVAKARAASSGNWYVVANYHPPGNMLGDFETNVLPRQ